MARGINRREYLRHIVALGEFTPDRLKAMLEAGTLEIEGEYYVLSDKGCDEVIEELVGWIADGVVPRVMNVGA